MTIGRSDFPFIINRLSISQIANMSPGNRKDFMNFIASGAPREDIEAAAVLLALEQYLTERHIPVDFKVNLNE